MKIAILTQPLGHNYGGIMQAYALQRVVRKMGHDATTIDRRFPVRAVTETFLKPLRDKLVAALRPRSSMSSLRANRRGDYSQLEDFLCRRVKRSVPIRRKCDLVSYFQEGDYDLTIVGSDQVWRPKYSPDIYNYFGDFLNEGQRVIAYAASFGVDDWEYNVAQTRRCASLIRKFQAVSVREDSAIQLCKNRLGVEAELVLDPTLLLSQKDYEDILSDPGSEGDGVFRYILDPSGWKTHVAQEVQTELGVSGFSTAPSPFGEAIRDEYKYPPVERWLGSFRSASFVVTDSFHGCAFAILFNKPFVVIGNERRGLSRFRSLLRSVGLLDRLITNASSDVLPIVRKPVDWDAVNEAVRRQQHVSIEFLSRWLHPAAEQCSAATGGPSYRVE